LEEYRQLYWPIISTVDDDDNVCDICLNDMEYADEKGHRYDKLVYCSLCEHVMHQRCYGSQLYKEIPKEDFFCQRCEHLMSHGL